ncbi:hypothetical protein FRC10_009333 [Ceratobasidium sp. 414]|nr:hypothetical protein FRC10_009333 [Ceratobasidium sp. 414]
MSTTSGIARIPHHQPSPASMAVASLYPANRTGGESLARKLAIEHLDSFMELVSALPIPYREAMTPLFQELHDLTVKRYKCTDVLASLEVHIQNDSWPSPLQGLQVPTFQFSKEFLADGTATRHIGKFKSTFNEFRRMTLQQVGVAKQEELEFLTTKIDVETWWPAWEKAAKTVYNQELVSRKILYMKEMPAIDEEGNAAHNPDGSVAKKVELAYKEDPVVKQTFQLIKEDLVRYGHKIRDIVMSKRRKETNATAKKADLKKKADVEMVDAAAGPSKETIAALVQAEVKRQIKPIPKKKEDGKKAGQNSSAKATSGRKPSNQQRPRQPSGGASGSAGTKKRKASGQQSGSAKKPKPS